AIAALAKFRGKPIDSYRDFIAALAERRRFFKSLGATATDHGVLEPFTESLRPHEAEELFQRGCTRQATVEEQRRFEANLLMEMARLSLDDGIVKTVGFTDDTRAFCSIPARHDLARRVDANWLARLVSRHIVGVGDARAMARALAYDLARSSYRLADVKVKGASRSKL